MHETLTSENTLATVANMYNTIDSMVLNHPNYALNVFFGFEY